MTPREVLLTEAAERDLEGIYDYVAAADSPAAARRLLDRLLEVTETLATFPERGAHPFELRALGIREYRQIMLKPYRLIYRVLGKRVVICLIADGRRNFQSLLAARLLGA